MANILNPTVVSIVKGSVTPIVRSLSYGGGTLPQINAAYQQANTALILAQDAYNYANTISGGSAIDNVARTAAATADYNAQNAWMTANSATVIAYSGYDQANAATVLAQNAYNYANTISGGSAIDNVARSAAAAADNKAQYAWNKANSASTVAGSAYNQANTANSNATSATNLAQAAFNKANNATVSAAGSNYQVQYNKSGNFAANSHFIYDYNQNTLHVDKIDAVIDAGTF